MTMITRIESGRLHIAKGATSSDLILKVVTALLITVVAATVLVHIESRLVGERALDLLTAEHHFAEFF